MAENNLSNNPTNNSDSSYLAPNFDIESFKDSTMDKFEKNKNVIYGSVAIFLALAVGLYYYFGVHKPAKIKEASEAIMAAQFAFERDSFQLALQGRDIAGQEKIIGFLDVIDNYGGTPSANIAQYGAGISLLHLGKYDEAITHLQSYSGNDGLTQAMAYGAIGDAKSELNQIDEALSFYLKAAGYQPNAATSPYYLRKSALLCELQGKAADAKKYIEQAIKDFPEAATKLNLENDLVRISKFY
jgi:tetratricopeptide (TPR) repeat protein